MMTDTAYHLIDGLTTPFTEAADRQMQGRIALVALPGVGRKSLFNSLLGWTAVNGTSERFHNLGLFTLIELSPEPYDVAGTLYRLENADLIVYMLDGRHDLSEEDFNWISRLRSIEATTLLVVNEHDEVPNEESTARLKLLSDRLGRSVLGLKAIDPASVRARLIPAMLKVCPDLAVALANELPTLRAQVARHIVFQNAGRCMTVGLETGITPDLDAYTGVQLRMIRQIAAIYGYKGRDRTRERLGLSLGLRYALRASLPLLGRVKRLEGWVSSGMVSAVMTLIIGYVAVLSYGGYLPNWLLRFTPIVGGGPHGSARPSRG